MAAAPAVVGAVLLRQLGHPGAVHGRRVGEHGHHHIMGGELVILGHLHAAEHVGNATDAHPGQLLQGLGVHTGLLGQIPQALLLGEEPQQPLGVLVVDVDDHVGVLHVVNPGDVLVADALNAVVAEAVVQDGGALEGLAHRQLHAGVDLLQVVAAADGARAAAGEAGAGEPVPGPLDALEQGGQGLAGDLVVPQMVAHLLKLVEDHAARVLPQLVGLVEDLLHVALAAGGGDDLRADGLQPLKPLPAHAGGQDGHAPGPPAAWS